MDQEEFLLEKEIYEWTYWLSLKRGGFGYNWVPDPNSATKFSSYDAAQDFLDCMTEEDVFVVQFQGSIV